MLSLVIGVDNAVIYLLKRSPIHLKGTGSTVKMTFLDFSSAFNTIQTVSGQSEAGEGGWGGAVTSWLHGSPAMSGMVICSTGVPPGYSLFTFPLHLLPCTSQTVATSKGSPTTLSLWGVCQRGATVTTGKPSWTLSTGVS